MQLLLVFIVALLLHHPNQFRQDEQEVEKMQNINNTQAQRSVK